MYQFQLLRYVPDVVKDEFVNIAVVLLDQQGRFLAAHMAGEEDLRRVRCLHPGADLELLRSWQETVAEQLARHPEDAGAWLKGLDDIGSHSLRWTAPAGFDTTDAAAAARELYDRLVASPPRPWLGARPRHAPWVKHEADSVFRAEHLLERFQSGIPAQQFTYPGDPFRIHYAYANGFLRYIHMLSLEYSVHQAKVLAFTFERMMRAGPAALTAVVEPEPRPVLTVQFNRQLLQDSGIEVLPLDRIQTLVRRVKQDLNLV